MPQMQLDANVQPTVFAAYGAMEELTAMLDAKQPAPSLFGGCFGGSQRARVRSISHVDCQADEP